MATIPVKQIDWTGGILPESNSLFISGGLEASGGLINFSDSTGIQLPGGIVVDEGGAGVFRKTGSFFSTSEELQITGSLKVQGTIETDTLIVSETILSSSVSYFQMVDFSGSSRFGDTLDDIHRFTGSLAITGSVLLDAEIVHTLASPFYQFVYNDDSQIQRYLTPSVAGDLIQYTGVNMIASNELDGGGF